MIKKNKESTIHSFLVVSIMNVHTQNIVRERKKRGETNELNRKIEKKKKENNKKKMKKKGRGKTGEGGITDI